MNETKKVYTTIDLGPTTMLFLTIVLLAVLKVAGYINPSWYIILSPLLIVVTLSAAVILYTFIKHLKNYFFD